MMLHTDVLCLLVIIIKNGDCLIPIFTSAGKESLSEEIPFDPDDNIFPVINHHKHCLYSITYCPISHHDDEIYQIACKFENQCPTGTRPQCVDEQGRAWKGILWICSPFKTCDRGSRDIVSFDQNKPHVYQLGKERCPDGFYHKVYTSPKESYCFNECQQDPSIRVYHKSTPERGPVVYCNYPDYCSTEQPKLFEHQPSELSPCKLASEQGLTLCPANSERLSDCKCDTRCKNGFKRDADDDFICKKAPQIFRPEDKLRLSDVLSIRQHSSGVCLIWDFPSVNNLTVIGVEVSYLDIADNLETYINQSCTKVTDIDGLVPGKVYDITVNIRYIHGNHVSSFTQKHKETIRPTPVVDVTVTTNGDIIDLNCFASKGSRQDHFHIEYRMVPRNRKTSWDNQNSPDCKLKLNTPFPGEEYEFKVSAVSNGVSSTEQTANIIVPPRPPTSLSSSIPYQRHVTISWWHDESVNHVEKWYLSYNSSDGDLGRREIHHENDEKRVETTLDNLRLGQTYSVLVYSSVGGVDSLKPSRKEIKTFSLSAEETSKTDNEERMFMFDIKRLHTMQPVFIEVPEETRKIR